MSAQDPDALGKKIRQSTPERAIRDLQALIKETTGHLVEQKDLRKLFDNHWSKLSFLAHAYHHEDVDR